MFLLVSVAGRTRAGVRAVITAAFWTRIVAKKRGPGARKKQRKRRFDVSTCCIFLGSAWLSHAVAREVA